MGVTTEVTDIIDILKITKSLNVLLDALSVSCIEHIIHINVRKVIVTDDSNDREKE